MIPSMSNNAVRVHLSVASSIDGYIDDASNERLVLSGEEDFADVHRERSRCDAILMLTRPPIGDVWTSSMCPLDCKPTGEKDE